MYCKYCGKEVVVDSKFCHHCGRQIEDFGPKATGIQQWEDPVEEVKGLPLDDQGGNAPEALVFGPSILKGQDGVFRWTYGMSMWKNPTILITVWKVFMIGAMFPVLLMTILTLFEEGFVEGMLIFLKMLLLMGGIMTGLVLIAYPIVAILNGGSYQVVFELDPNGIRHLQLDKQFKKNQVMAWIAVLAGVASGKPQVAGAGLLAGTKQSSYSDFNKVQKIVAKPKRHVIYVNESLQHNQVYVAKADFDQVLAYITDHCQKASVK